jgi:hypothetical protein
MLNNAVWLLLQCSLYTCEINNWDQKSTAEKIWTNLKAFIQEAYTHHLNTTSITAGSQGYTQDAFVVPKESDNNNDNIQLLVTQMVIAALTM